MDRQPQFVTGFLGRRDSYQVPQALAEAGMLGRFITGVYDVGARARLLRRRSARARTVLEARHCAGIPEDRVDARWGIEAVQHLSRFVGDKSNRSWEWAGRSMSRAIRDEVRRTGGDLMVYEPYAWEALTASYVHRPRKILFHFHLHPLFERRILDEDCRAYPLPGGAWQRLDALPENDGRIVDAWRHADRVLCASSFTKRSLMADGMPAEKGIVIPYGMDAPEGEIQGNAPEIFSVLFVGSGLQRKGIHHLLAAWSRARLPKGASLTLVCRFLDPVLEEQMSHLPSGVRLLRGVSGTELQRLFETSALFVLPSLVEGFGQVFLEALSRGCPVLGTSHTCLPDLGGEEEGIFLTEAGNVEALKTMLESLPVRLLGPDARELRLRAAALAHQNTWERFRRRLAEVLLEDPVKE